MYDVHIAIIVNICPSETLAQNVPEVILILWESHNCRVIDLKGLELVKARVLRVHDTLDFMARLPDLS